jgi:hypothetical protein
MVVYLDPGQSVVMDGARIGPPKNRVPEPLLEIQSSQLRELQIEV